MNKNKTPDSKTTPSLEMPKMNPYVPAKAKVLEFFRESPDNFSIIIDFKTKHEPGQFVMVGLPGIGEAPISICSYSSEHMKLNIREVGSVTNSLAKVKEGDFVFVRGPYGTGYPMNSLEGNNIIMIGGGCGVAPLKGVIDYLSSNRKKYKDIDLLFGYRSVHDILFKREIETWKQHYNTMISIDKADDADKNVCYDAKVGFVTEHLKKSDIPVKSSVVFICGPPKMMELVIEILKEKGFESEQIFVSTERLMQCALGKCGHCMIRGKYTCMDGPVFRLDEVEKFKND